MDWRVVYGKRVAQLSKLLRDGTTTSPIIPKLHSYSLLLVEPE